MAPGPSPSPAAPEYFSCHRQGDWNTELHTKWCLFCSINRTRSSAWGPSRLWIQGQGAAASAPPRGPGSLSATWPTIRPSGAYRGADTGQAPPVPDTQGSLPGQTISWDACASLPQKHVLPGTGCHLRTENIRSHNLALWQVKLASLQVAGLGLWAWAGTCSGEPLGGPPGGALSTS